MTTLRNIVKRNAVNGTLLFWNDPYNEIGEFTRPQLIWMEPGEKYVRAVIDRRPFCELGFMPTVTPKDKYDVCRRAVRNGGIIALSSYMSRIKDDLRYTDKYMPFTKEEKDFLIRKLYEGLEDIED